ncbi:MAG: hypothetical protein RL368_1289 [Pseudomonadota bacterium]|jgi:modulator of FtsH protease
MQPNKVVDFNSAASALGTTVVSSSDTNKLIRNTYMLLSMTLLFSAVTAGIAMVTAMPPIHWAITLVAYFALFFATAALRNSVWGLVAVFALTGFMGFTLGPILNLYMSRFANGNMLVMMSFASTAAVFVSLSAYALTTRKDFSFLGNFIFAGMIVAMLLGIGAIVFQLPMLSLGISAMVVLLMVGSILFQTSEIVNGHETNYIMATVGLYVSIYNLFISLLQLLAALFGEE